MAKQKTIDPIVELKDLVDEIVHTEGIQPDEAFVLWFIRSHLLEDQTASRNCLTRRGNEKGVDGIYIDHAARQVDIIQGKYRTKRIGKPEARQDVMQLAFYGRLMSQEEDNIAQLAETVDVSVEPSFWKRAVLFGKRSMISICTLSPPEPSPVRSYEMRKTPPA